MKMKKSLMFDDIADLFKSGDDNVERYKNFYRSTFHRSTSLSDDDIINLVADSQDDDSPEGWAKKMQEIEQAPVPA